MNDRPLTLADLDELERRLVSGLSTAELEASKWPQLIAIARQALTEGTAAEERIAAYLDNWALASIDKGGPDAVSSTLQTAAHAIRQGLHLKEPADD